MLQTSPALAVEDLIDNPNFVIDDFAGYVYVTTHMPTGRKYIGKKQFFHTTTKKLGKKELLEIPVTKGRRPTKKSVTKESDWKTYHGSASEIKLYPPEEMMRHILKLCRTKKELTYYEAKYLFQYDVLQDRNYINDNILGKFYTKDLMEAK
jgi:hypothetical protein